MLSRLPVVLGLASLALLPALALSGCSSSQRRDQNYGTDAGTDFQIPDAAGFPSQLPDSAEVDGGSLDAQAALSTAEVAPDTGFEVDGGSLDVPAVLSAAEVAPDVGLDDLPADASVLDFGPGVDS